MWPSLVCVWALVSAHFGIPWCFIRLIERNLIKSKNSYRSSSQQTIGKNRAYSPSHRGWHSIMQTWTSQIWPRNWRHAVGPFQNDPCNNSLWFRSRVTQSIRNRSIKNLPPVSAKKTMYVCIYIISSLFADWAPWLRTCLVRLIKVLLLLLIKGAAS